MYLQINRLSFSQLTQLLDFEDCVLAGFVVDGIISVVLSDEDGVFCGRGESGVTEFTAK
jgi:hypothetical protein